MNDRIKTIWIWAAAIFLGLLLPFLVQRGMFLDGVTYAAIAKNLSLGVGSFWAPHYTPTLYPVFYEHPPLVFSLQSILFDLFGDQFWVERLYSFLMGLAVIGGMLFCLCQLFDRQKAWLAAAVAVILWISIPQVFWSFRNNMLENTSSVFTLLSVGSFLAFRQKGKLWNAILGSLFLVAAFLSKGPTALFPLVAPFVAVLVFGRSQKLKYTATAYTTVGVLVSVFYLSSEGLQSNLAGYMEAQVLPALKGKREITTDNRFAIIGKFILEGLLSFVLIGIAIAKRRKFKISRSSVFFFFIALSASLPMIISLKQRSYYLVPAFPFLAMAAAVTILPVVELWMARFRPAALQKARVSGLTAIGLILVITAIKFGSYSRNEDLNRDADLLAKEFPRGTVFSTSGQDWENWGFHAALARASGQGLDMDQPLEYYLIYSSGTVPKGYEQVEIGLKKIELYRRQD
ncbi:MAG: glycosyltransferase family 39 protein [Cryomorphaceae bacterium]